MLQKNIYGSHIKERGQLHMVSTDSIYSVRQWLLLQPALQDPKSVAGCWQLKLQSATVNKIDDKEDQEQQCKERHESLLQKRWFVPVGKSMLSRFPNRERQSGTKGVSFCPGSGNRDKRSFFYVFLFSILFLFQLYFCISIKLMYGNSVCMISTNIYIYIVTYIIFVLDSFHI